jgi:hypothetical protein
MNDEEFDRLLAEYLERRRKMAAKKRVDWPQVAGFTVVVTAVVVLALWLDPDRAEKWITLVPGILGAVGMGYSMLRGRALPKDGGE